MNLKFNMPAAILLVAFLLVSPPASFGAVTHVVAKGDSLYTIAKKYKVSVEDLKSGNNLASSKLKIGAVLKVQPAENIAAKKASKKPVNKAVLSKKVVKNPSSVTATATETRVVKKGESLLAIARECGISVGQLKKMNGLKKNSLKIGQKLKVPASEYEEEIVTVKKENQKTEPAGSPSANEEPVQLVSQQDEATPPDTAVEDLSQEETLRIQHLLNVATNFIGVPYKFGGGTRKGIDCSAFVQKVFGFLSVDLPRTAREQFRVGEKIPKDNLKEGDLVFFKTYAKYPSHVGIYIGDNKFIHASSRDKRVSVSTLNSPYYTKRFIGAKRMPVQDKF